MMIENENDDDDRPQLSADTLQILQEWQQEQETNKTGNNTQEDWVRVPRCYSHCRTRPMSNGGHDRFF
jgi:hypothetical protein